MEDVSIANGGKRADYLVKSCGSNAYTKPSSFSGVFVFACCLLPFAR